MFESSLFRLLISLLILLSISNAITIRRDKSILYSRVLTQGLIYSAILLINSYFIIDISFLELCNVFSAFILIIIATINTRYKTYIISRLYSTNYLILVGSAFFIKLGSYLLELVGWISHYNLNNIILTNAFIILVLYLLTDILIFIHIKSSRLASLITCIGRTSIRLIISGNIFEAILLYKLITDIIYQECIISMYNPDMPIPGAMRVPDGAANSEHNLSVLKKQLENMKVSKKCIGRNITRLDGLLDERNSATSTRQLNSINIRIETCRTNISTHCGLLDNLISTREEYLNYVKDVSSQGRADTSRYRKAGSSYAVLLERARSRIS